MLPHTAFKCSTCDILLNAILFECNTIWSSCVILLIRCSIGIPCTRTPSPSPSHFLCLLLFCIPTRTWSTVLPCVFVCLLHVLTKNLWFWFSCFRLSWMNWGCQAECLKQGLSQWGRSGWIIISTYGGSSL